MIKYTSTDSFYINNRGLVFSVKNDKDRPRDNSGLLNEIVEIDGKLYIVKGVESFAKFEILKDEPIGLLVEEYKK